MQKKSVGLLSALIISVLGIVAVVSVFIVYNLPNKNSQSSTTEPTTTPELLAVYPAPMRSLAEQAAMAQGVYPPPATKASVPTNIAPVLKITASPTTKGNLTSDDVQSTSQEEAKVAFDSKKAIFLDVRSTLSYDRSHIPGAISIPETEIKERLSELDPGQWIITYCS